MKWRIVGAVVGALLPELVAALADRRLSAAEIARIVDAVGRSLWSVEVPRDGNKP